MRTVKSVTVLLRFTDAMQGNIAKALLIWDYCGSAYGSRTRVPALRGLCPNH